MPNESCAGTIGKYQDKRHESYEHSPLRFACRDLRQSRICAGVGQEAILDAYSFDEKETTLLDFGCGPGLLSRELAPECKRVVGVDTSEKMVARFNERVYMQGIPFNEMQAVCIREDIGEELGTERFDVVVSSMVYHHLEYPEDTTKALARCLKPGGCLLIADVATLDGKMLDKYPGIVMHTEGFTEDRMRDIFEAAGLSDFSFDVVSSAKMDGVEVNLFLATAEKPAEQREMKSGDSH